MVNNILFGTGQSMFALILLLVPTKLSLLNLNKIISFRLILPHALNTVNPISTSLIYYLSCITTISQAFGAVEAMSDRICIKSKGKHKPFLSAENLVSCCSSCGMGCNGGFPHSAWLYWKNQGIVTGDLYNTTNGCQPYEFPPCEHHVVGPLPSCGDDVVTPPCKTTCQPGYNISYEKDKWYGKLNDLNTDSQYTYVHMHDAFMVLKRYIL